MFEAISFLTQNKQEPKNPVDIGILVECMLFYGNTTVVADRAILTQLLRYFGEERLSLLVKEDLLNIVYTVSHVGIRSQTKNNIQYYDPVEFSITKEKGGPGPPDPQQLFQDQLLKICTDVTGKTGKGRRISRRLQEIIQVSRHDHIILEGAENSILDQGYVDSAAKIVIKEFVPEVGNISGASFHTQKTDDGIMVATNINFESLNQLHQKRVPTDTSLISATTILSALLEVEKELYFSSSNLSELASSSLSAKLAAAKIDYVLNRSVKSSEALNRFTGFLFEDAKAIREAVNSGQIDLDKLISVLQKSKRFKKWIIDVKPDADLIKNYHEEVTKGTVVDKLPGKTARWTLFTGIGFTVDAMGADGLGTAAGIALSVLDTFYLDKLIKGWKPNQFIEDDVKKLIRMNNDIDIDL